MRFGLLAVFALAVLLPSLSEGRIVSKCELREKLGRALPPKTKENILARVVCEVGRRTQFDTSRLTGICNRTSTPPAIAQPNQTRPEMIGNTTTQNNQTAAPGPAQPNQTRPGVGPAQTTGAGTTSAQPNQTRPGVEPSQTTGAGTTSAQTNQTTPGTMVTTTIQRNQTAPSGTGARRRRDAKDSEEEDEIDEDKDRSSPCLYGLFQLSDRIACNSGYHSTKNACTTKCDVFLDDDIGDDIACLVQSQTWKDLLSDSKCSPKDLGNYFAECVK